MDIPPVGGVINECQQQQPSGSNLPGVFVLMGNIQLTSCTGWEFQYLQNSSKILLCISFEGEPGPHTKAILLFLDCFLSLHSLSSFN